MTFDDISEKHFGLNHVQVSELLQLQFNHWAKVNCRVEFRLACSSSSPNFILITIHFCSTIHFQLQFTCTTRSRFFLLGYILALGLVEEWVPKTSLSVSLQWKKWERLFFNVPKTLTDIENANSSAKNEEKLLAACFCIVEYEQEIVFTLFDGVVSRCLL